MDRRNYKSDYDFVLRLIDCHGEPVGWPSCDFEAVFFTTSVARGLKIWSKGGETGNCYNDEGRIHVAAKNAMLPPGKVEFELTLYVPDERFEGGVRKVVERKETGIELVTGGELCTCTFVVSAPLPVVGVIDTVVKETEERHYAELKGDLAALEEKLRGEAEAGDAETRRAAAEGDAVVRDWAAGRFDDFDSMLGQEMSDVRGEIDSEATALREEMESLRTSTEAALEKAEERASDALNLAKEELQAADAEMQAQLNAIEEATEDEVLGALVEIPEGIAGTPVGYVMVKETMPASEWNHEEWGDEEWCLYGYLVAVPVGDIEVYCGDVFVGMGKKYDADGYEVDAEIRLVVDDRYGDDYSLRSEFSATEEELPVLPNIYAGMILKVYREEEEE